MSCKMHGREKEFMQNVNHKTTGRNLGVDARTVLKYIVKKVFRSCELQASKAHFCTMALVDTRKIFNANSEW